MSILAFCIGIALPTACGWFLVGALQGKNSILTKAEHIALGAVVGMTLSMFLLFVLNVAGVMSFSRIQILFSIVGLLLMSAALWWKYGRGSLQIEEVPSFKKELRTLPTWGRIAVGLLMFWTVLKLMGATVTLVGTPTYYDDVYKNWNMRGKVFFISQELTLNTENISGYDVLGELSSYPPTVSLSKMWLATLAGNWSEPLINSVHILWFVCLLVLLYGQLRRMTRSALWAGLGVYLYTSLPLVLVHAGTAYAEIFASVHLVASILLLYRFFAEQEVPKRSALLRLLALSLACLAFTKNEVLLLYMPIFALFILVHFWVTESSASQKVRTLLWLGIFTAIVLGPWLLFKWANGMTFGNAKAVSGLGIGWQPGAFISIVINTFLEGNWSLLPAIFVALVLWRWKEAFGSKLVVLSAFFLITVGLQCSLFLFTSLSTEATNQTGIARGFLQIVPLAVIIVTVLLRNRFTITDSQ